LGGSVYITGQGEKGFCGKKGGTREKGRRIKPWRKRKTNYRP